MIYSFDEIMSEHEFHAPNEMAGYLLHGGLDREGKYISPVSYTHLTLPTILLV